MTLTLKLKLLSFALLIFSLLFLTPSQSFVFAQACPAAGCPAAGIIQVQQLITRLINVSVTIAFMAMTVWLAWSAIKFFITSGGDPKALAAAWSSVTWIFMGIVFMVLAYLAIKLIAAFSGANIENYCLGFPPYCI